MTHNLEAGECYCDECQNRRTGDIARQCEHAFSPPANRLTIDTILKAKAILSANDIDDEYVSVSQWGLFPA